MYLSVYTELCYLQLQQQLRVAGCVCMCVCLRVPLEQFSVGLHKSVCSVQLFLLSVDIMSSELPECNRKLVFLMDTCSCLVD